MVLLLIVGWLALAVGLVWGVQRLAMRRKGAELPGGGVEPPRGLRRLGRLMEGSESVWPGSQGDQQGSGHHHGGHGSMGGHHDGGGFGGGGHHG